MIITFSTTNIFNSQDHFLSGRYNFLVAKVTFQWLRSLLQWPRSLVYITLSAAKIITFPLDDITFSEITL